MTKLNYFHKGIELDNLEMLIRTIKSYNPNIIEVTDYVEKIFTGMNKEYVLNELWLKSEDKFIHKILNAQPYSKEEATQLSQKKLILEILNNKHNLNKL